MVDKLAYRFSCFVKARAPESRSLEVINYGMIIIFNLLFATLITLMISLILGTLLDTLIGMIAFALLRQFAGGYHLKTSDACVVGSTLILLSIPYITDYINGFELYLDTLSLIILSIFAPQTIKFKYASSPKTYKKFKVISLLIVGINAFLFHSTILTITFFIVSLTVIIGVISNYKR